MMFSKADSSAARSEQPPHDLICKTTRGSIKQRAHFASLIRVSGLLSLSLLVVMPGGLLKPEAAALSVSFGPKTDFDTGSQPHSVAEGDFNGDGKVDLAIANSNSQTVSILLGTGTGTFGAKTDFDTGNSPFSVTVGDFNDDGKLDLAVGNQGSNTVSILLGTGTGTFGAKTDFGTDGGAQGLAVGDFNGDGNLDLATANYGPDSVSILLGTGAGTLGAKTDFDAGGGPVSVAVGDFNGDGKLDLATANYGSGTVSILLGTGSGVFGEETDFGTGSAPRSVAVGDFNGDGKLDLATANQNSNTVSILLGTGTGDFGAKTDFGTGTTPISVAAGDFNGDGKLDLALADFNGDTVSILLGTGIGTLGPKADFGTGGLPRSVAVGDFNSDGTLDLAVANEGVSTVSILLNTTPIAPSGVFCPKNDFRTGLNPASVAVGEFNNDGKLDLAVTNRDDNTVSILLGTVSGTFGPKTDFGTGSQPFSVAVGDFNSDGKLDLAVANSFSSDTVSILLGTGTGSFGAKTDFATGVTPRSVAVGDFNGDGKPDLAVANFTSNTVSILPGTGTGTFGAKTDFGTGIHPLSVAVGDFNGDGKLDLAVANEGSDTISILLGTGTGTFGAKTDFGTGTQPFSVAVGDFNGDGKLDLAVTNSGSDTASILLGTGTGTFGAKTDFGTGERTRSVAVGNFNGDGKLDLAVANHSGTISILLGTGTGTFGAKTDFSAGYLPFSIAVGDFNADGKLDLVVTNLSNTVSVLVNACSNTPPGITATPVSQTAGDPAANSQIATANDAEDATNTLTVTVNGGTSVTDNGVTVTLNPTAPNASGQVFADVVAACTASTANFTLRVTDSGGLFSEATLTVTVNPTPAPTASTGGPQTICESGTTVNLGGNTPAAGETGTWSIVPAGVTGTFNPNANTPGATFTHTSGGVGGTITLRWTVTNPTCGQSATADAIITVKQHPTATAGGPQTICALSTTAGLGGNTPSGGATGTWSIVTAGATGTFNPNASAPNATFTHTGGTGTITLRWTVSNPPCPNGVAEVMVTVNQPPTTATVGPNQIIPPGGTTTPLGGNTASSGTGMWSIVTAGATGTFNPNASTPNATWTHATGNSQVVLRWTIANPPCPTSQSDVTIQIGIAATITCPASPVVANTAPGQCSATVTFNVTATGLPNPTVTCVPPSGSVFQKGNTTVNCTAANGIPPDSACSFTVTVNDTQPPTIMCPANITKPTDPNLCAAVVTYITSVASDNCACGVGAPVRGKPTVASCSVVCSPASGATFPKGTTTVTCTATDTSGNQASCSFTVTVNDTQPPAIACSTNVVKATDPNLCSAVVAYPVPVVSDNCPGVGTPVCNAASGSTFPKGTTTVTCGVGDASGNQSSCSFTVTVNDTQQPSITCPPNITAKTPQAGNPCVVVNYATPVATDNCPSPTVVCTPPSGSCFPLGTTTVTCTATDTSGNTATCTFKVNVFDLCLQDDSNPSTVALINSFTGDYRFCCNGVTYTGRGTMTIRGSAYTLEHNPLDRRVLVKDDEGVHKGSGSISAPPGTIRCTITDRNTQDNSCVCQ